MVLDEPGRPLQARELPDPELDPSRPGDLLVEVHACGVCRTDLHIRDGEVRGSKLPVVPGHQIVATVLAAGADAAHAPGARVGIPWLGWTDGTCRFCTSGRENLCVSAQFTGLDRDGGYATRAVADARYAFALPDGFGDLEAAPLLCAGLIGHRALRMTGDARAPRALRLRRECPHHLPGCPPPGPARLRLHAGGRPRLAGLRPGARVRMGGRRARSGARGARRGDHLRPGRRARARGAARSRSRRRRRLRGHPHERHPVVRLRAAVGRARAAIGGQPHARGCRRVPRPRPAGAGAHARDDLRAGGGRAARWTRSARARSRAPRCWSPRSRPPRARVRAGAAP